MLMATTMLPPPDLLPDVLPTQRLTASGRPAPPVREELRRIPSLRNAVTVVGVLLQSFGVIAVAVWSHNVFVYAVAYLLMGRAFALYAILGHEAAHRLLFARKGPNDLIGRWLLSYPSFTAFDAYRRAHMAHHKDEMGPEEPDFMLYAPYPVPPDSFRRKLTRDAFFISGYKNLRGLWRAFRRPGPSRRVAGQIIAAQVAVWAVLIGLFGLGHWWLYPVLWLAPWMSVWKVINRLRAIAEHGGMTRSPDRRLTTHHVRQTWPARFWMVPFNTGYHLAHHVDIGIPFRSLPRLHRELVEAGWVPDELEYPNYRSLWRALASGPPKPRA
jgi:fatty acid desaturase